MRILKQNSNSKETHPNQNLQRRHHRSKTCVSSGLLWIGIERASPLHFIFLNSRVWIWFNLKSSAGSLAPSGLRFHHGEPKDLQWVHSIQNPKSPQEMNSTHIGLVQLIVSSVLVFGWKWNANNKISNWAQPKPTSSSQFRLDDFIIYACAWWSADLHFPLLLSLQTPQFCLFWSVCSASAKFTNVKLSCRCTVWVLIMIPSSNSNFRIQTATVTVQR